MGSKKRNISLYGNIGLERGYCKNCKSTCIILDGRKLCCNGRVEHREIMSLPIQRMSIPSEGKRHLCKSVRDKIIMEQNYKCIYCDMPFGSIYVRGDNPHPHKTTIHFDHFIPFIYSSNNHVDNFVAACNICNSIKSDKMFNNLDEATIYVIEKAKNKKITYL